MHTEHCKYRAVCSARVILAESCGRLVPIDAQPFRRDDVEPEDRWLLVVRVHEKPRMTQVGTDLVDEVYVKHAVTCPAVVTARVAAQMRTTSLVARVAQYRMEEHP